MLEPEIAGLAAERIEEQVLGTMREAVVIMDRSLRDPDAYVEADLDFHLAMAEAAGNPLILSLLDSIVGLLREQRSRIFNVDARTRARAIPSQANSRGGRCNAIPRPLVKPCALISSKCSRIRRLRREAACC